jgi:hypothetical protein
VKFGKPAYVPQGAHEDPHLLRVFTDGIMHAIAELTGQTYRNRYSYTKRLGGVDAPAPITFTV